MRRSLALVLLVACAHGADEAPPPRPLLTRPVLAEAVVVDPGEAGRAVAEAGARAEPAAHLVVATFPARAEQPALRLTPAAPVDVSAHDLLRVAIENRSRGRALGRIELVAGDRAASYAIALEPGANDVALPCWTLQAGDDRPVDRRAIGAVRVVLARAPDEIALAIGPVRAQTVFAHHDRIRFFDCGAGEVAAGACALRAASAYSPERGYGVAPGARDREWENQRAFPLFSGGIDGDRVELRVDAPAGQYEAQAVAFGTAWDGPRTVSYRILANGEPAVDVRVTPKSFWSTQNLYLGSDVAYDERRPLFDQYHRAYYAPHRFAVASANGAIALAFERCPPRALWLYPAEIADEGRAFVEACIAEQSFALWSRSARVRAHAEPAPAEPLAATADDERRGFQLFARPYFHRLYAESTPAAADALPAEGLSVACAPGEDEPATLALRPLKDLADVSFAIEPFAERAVSARVGVVQRVPQRVGGIWMEAAPLAIVPHESPLAAHAGRTEQMWATVRVAEGAPAGDQRAAIVVSVGGREAARVPLTVRVRPFALPRATSECGMYDSTAFSAHAASAFPDDPYVQQVLDAEARDLADHGINGITLPSPTAVAYDRERHRVKLDFSGVDRVVDALTRAGMRGRHVISVMNVIQYKLMNPDFAGLEEFSPEFDDAFVDLCVQLRDWAKAKNVAVVHQIFDEPRETDINDWNRNRVAMTRYFKLARRVPDGLPTMTTLMGDNDEFGHPYTPLIALMDIVSCHSWQQSAQSMYLATKENLAQLWTYNNGFTRFAFGFHLWKEKSLGHWQWVYTWDTTFAHLPVLGDGESNAALPIPGGYAPTLKWEMVREGVDDRRYLAALEARLAQAGDAPAAVDARAFLAALDRFLPLHLGEGLSSGAEAGALYDGPERLAWFDPWREQIAEYVAALDAKRAAKRLDAAWAMFPHAVAETERALACRVVAKAPTIDGDGADPAWTAAEVADGFVELERGEPAVVATSVKVARDADRLYVLFRCDEPKYGELKAYATERDGDCWADDAVELFLDTAGDKAHYKHIVVNCLGTIEDDDTRDGVWNGDVVAAVKRSKGAWWCELSISLASLGGKAPADGVAWGVNFCRDRQPAPAQSSSWAFVGHSFHTPQKFARLVFKP